MSLSLLLGLVGGMVRGDRPSTATASVVTTTAAVPAPQTSSGASSTPQVPAPVQVSRPATPPVTVSHAT